MPQALVDIHVHALPDDRPRSLDAIEAARQARARGLRAIVLKNHYESTAGLSDGMIYFGRDKWIS